MLSNDNVHVWFEVIDKKFWEIHKFLKILSPDEKLRAERFHFEHDRKRFIIRRGQLRIILSRYLDIDPGQIQFCYGHYGKPLLSEDLNKRMLRFNLTHSHGLALYAIARNREVGIDLELIRPITQSKEIVEQYFSPQENAIFMALPSTEKQKAFLTCWTRKEAYTKARGEGLFMPLDRFDVSLVPGEPAALSSAGGNPRDTSSWSLREIATKPGYVAAAVVEGHNWRPVYC